MGPFAVGPPRRRGPCPPAGGDAEWSGHQIGATLSLDRHSSSLGRFVRTAQRTGTLMVVCVVIWIIGGGGSFWPAWVILAGGLLLARQAYRTFVAAPDWRE